MNNEFKKISKGDVTRYVLENASSGGTSSGSVASVSMPIGSTRKRGDNILAQEADKKTVPVSTPRNFVAKNAKTGGAGQHKDKSKTIPRKEKHKKPVAEAEKKGLYYYVNKRKKAGTSRGADSPKAPTAQAWKDAAKTAKTEGVAEGFNGEYDDEAGMAQSNLLTTARAVMGLLKTIKDRDNLPEWGQEKIAKAEMMLVSVWDYLQSQKAMGNDPQQGVAEAAALVTHRIGLTVTDPNHPMVSKRGETYQKSVRVTGPDREAAINQAIAHYRRKGYKVHDHHYLGTVDKPMAEATGDKPFDQMMTTIKRGTNKQKTADRKEQQKQTQQQARNAFGNMFGGGNPADKLKIREQGVEEGSWDDIKKFGKKAAVAGAIGLGIGAANAGGWSPSDVPAGGHNQLPDIVANVKFKVGDKEISKEINLGSHYRSPGEASKELENFLKSKGIKFYEYSLERVKPKANDKIDNSPATSDMKGSMDTTEPAATGPSTDNYMAKDNDPERGPSMGGKFVKEDPYLESLQNMMERQLEPNMELDTWVDNFQNADPQKYHQFKNKTPEKKK